MIMDKPYFCRSQTGAETECYPTVEEAIQAGEQKNFYPFTVCQIVIQPVMNCNSPPKIQHAQV
jgi:hypothetical protein